jgi:predicted RNase H-like HicB family nuclease
MTKPHYSELVFDVTEEADGGYVAECLSENIVTQGDTWDELRANVKEAVAAYFFDGPKPQAIRLHLQRNEVFLMQ